MKLAVLGHPIKHSKSPLIHTYWIKAHKLNSTYDAIDIMPDALTHDLGKLIRAGYDGFNVTAPHKENIMAYCDFIDPKAHDIGAVNTLHLKENKLYGFNTDSYGFQKNIEENTPDSFSWTTGPVLVIGAGGAARAAMRALKDMNAPEIRVANRTPTKAYDLVDHFSGHVVPWDKLDEATKGAALIINTTSLGLDGTSCPPLSFMTAPKDAIVCDLVYAPLETPFLMLAKENGLYTVTGIDMLLYQAQKAFEIWHGIPPDIDNSLRRSVLK